MLITLKKKADQSDHDPIIIMMNHPRETIKSKIVCKVAIGESIETCSLHEDMTEDEGNMLAYSIMARYKGLFEQAGKVAHESNEKAKRSYQNKSMEAQI